ncbi:hypothetical protein QJS04_geneDACA019693 [Acorus gramineus]|uniref:Uncharacterized protein n=1 Tax=Acorus gramineus TaxID=55184 RepID=A0AAV9B1Z1_ACOGR|nr:hypothetical protein QJS04_geneDACA019693 [Acorus gramineus]
MFASFLFPVGHYNCPLPLLSYLDDLEGTWRYAWAISIREQLMESVRKVWPSIVSRNEGKYLKSSIGYLFGCMVVSCVSLFLFSLLLYLSFCYISLYINL